MQNSAKWTIYVTVDLLNIYLTIMQAFVMKSTIFKVFLQDESSILFFLNCNHESMFKQGSLKLVNKPLHSHSFRAGLLLILIIHVLMFYYL